MYIFVYINILHEYKIIYVNICMDTNGAHIYRYIFVRIYKYARYVYIFIYLSMCI